MSVPLNFTLHPQLHLYRILTLNSHFVAVHRYFSIFFHQLLVNRDGELEELWTDFGSLTEIWLDGGSPIEMKANLTQLFRSLQPQALALNGEGISASPGRWSGTEGDVPPGWPNSWSTTCCDVNGTDPAHTCEGSGCAPNDPRGTAFYASSSTDYTLQV